MRSIPPTLQLVCSIAQNPPRHSSALPIQARMFLSISTSLAGSTSLVSGATITYAYLYSAKVSPVERGLAVSLISLSEFAKICGSNVARDCVRTGLKKLAALSKNKTGKAMDNANRMLRETVGSFMTLVTSGLGDGISMIHLEGKIHKTGMSEMEHAAMEGSTMTLQNVYYCQSSLASSRDLPSIGKLNSIIMHDFLLVETEVMINGKSFKKYIRAEKVAFPKDCTGIVISFANECNEEGVRGCETFKMECRGKPTTLKDLETILEDYDPHYSLKNSCCWDYARDMSKKLLRYCQDLPQTSKQEKQRLENEINSVVPRITHHGGAVAEFTHRSHEFLTNILERVAETC